MNKITFFLLFIICITSCALSRKSMNAKVLTYDVKTEILDDSKSKTTMNYLIEKYGDSLDITYDSRGNIRTDYFGSGAMGMKYIIYNSDKKINCAKYNNLDTLYFYDATINEYTLDSVNRENTSKGFILTYYSQNPYAESNIIQEFHFINDSLQVKAELYKDFNDFSYGEILANSGCLPIKTILTLEGIRITKELLKVKTIEDPEISFFNPKNIVLKEM